MTTTESFSISIPSDLIEVIDSATNRSRANFFYQGAKKNLVYRKPAGDVKALYKGLCGLELSDNEDGKNLQVILPEWLVNRIKSHCARFAMDWDSFFENAIEKYLSIKEFDHPVHQKSQLAKALIREYAETDLYGGILP